MTMTYKTVTGQITQPGSNIGIRARVIATPLTTNTALAFTGDDRISIGPQTAVTDAAGNLATLKIPTNVDLPELYWRITAQALDKVPGVPEAWTIKTAVVVTGTGSVLLKDLLEVDTLAVSTDFLVNISDLVTDAENAAADAEGSQLAAETAQTAAAGSATAASGSATAAAGSASTASSAATTATTKAGEASASATAAAGSASAAATSESNAAASEAAAATSETNAAASETAAEGYAASAAGSVSLVAWAPTTAYAAGDVRQAPDGSTIRRLANGTSGATFDTTEEAAWEAVLGNGTTIDGKALSASNEVRARLTKQEIGALPEMVIQTLLWTPDETLTATSCTVGADRQHCVVGDRGIRMTVASAIAARVQMSPMLPTSPLYHPPASVVGLKVWVDDPTKVTRFQVDIRTVNGDTSTSMWTRTSDDAANPTIRAGWNQFRWGADGGTVGDWTKIDYARVSVVTSAATAVTVGHLWLECPRKAQLIMMSDGCHRSFDANLADPLHDRGFPITWGISDPTYMEDASNGGAQAAIRLSISELLARQEMGDSVSFHGGPLNIMSTASKQQVRLWTAQTQKWLQSRGFRGWFYRAAWLQNDAPNASAADSLLAASPTSTQRSGLNAWPLTRRSSYPRVTLHGSTEATIAALFAKMKQTHQLGVFYTHEVLTTGGFGEGGANLTVAERDFFLSQIDAGIAEGWLEGVTFETLFARSGARWRQTFAGPSFEFEDEYGQTIRLGAGAANPAPVSFSTFSPTNFDLVGWWSPRDAGVADGATFTRYRDQGDVGNDFDTVSGAPTYSATGLNGTPAVSFNGSSWFTMAAPGLDVGTGNGPLTLLVNAKASAIGTIARGIIGGNSSFDLYVSSSAGTPFVARRGLALTGSAADTSAHTFLVEFNGASSSLEIDGAVVASGDAGNQGQTTLALGNWADGTKPFTGVIGDVVLIKGLLSSSDKAAARTWLGARRGVVL